MKKRNILTKKEWIAKAAPKADDIYKGVLSSLKKDLMADIDEFKKKALLSIEAEINDTIEKQAKRLIKKKIESYNESDVVAKKRTINKVLRR